MTIMRADELRRGHSLSVAYLPARNYLKTGYQIGGAMRYHGPSGIVVISLMGGDDIPYGDETFTLPADYLVDAGGEGTGWDQYGVVSAVASYRELLDEYGKVPASVMTRAGRLRLQWRVDPHGMSDGSGEPAYQIVLSGEDCGTVAPNRAGVIRKTNRVTGVKLAAIATMRAMEGTS